MAPRIRIQVGANRVREKVGGLTARPAAPPRFGQKRMEIAARPCAAPPPLAGSDQRLISG